MPERTYEIKPVGVDYVCDKCNTGVMVHNSGIALMCNPPQFVHVCSNCGHEQQMLEVYPTLRWERAPGAC